MRALVIAPQPFFTPRGTPFSVYYRTRTMADLGVEIDLLTYGQGQDVAIPNVRIRRIPDFSVFGRIRTGPSLLKLFLDIFIGLYATALLLRYRHEIVHAHEEAAFMARFLKPVFGFRFIYDMHSSLPEQLGNFSFTRSRVLTRIFEWLERTTLRAADAIIVICPALLETVRKIPDTTGKVILIENSLFDTVPTNSARTTEFDAESLRRAEQWSDEGNPLVVYTGTLESYQGIDLLLDAFSRVATDNGSVNLLIVGGQPEQVEAYRRKAEELGIEERCFFTGTTPQQVAMRCYEIAALIVSPRVYGTNTPLKIYAQLASRVPIIATRIESHTQVLGENVAFLADPVPAAFAAAMRQALDQPEVARVKANEARRLYETEYAPDAYVGKMRSLLELVNVRD
jgi:glycosyltransferase involved in cell wall biosynthesis